MWISQMSKHTSKITNLVEFYGFIIMQNYFQFYLLQSTYYFFLFQYDMLWFYVILIEK